MSPCEGIHVWPPAQIDQPALVAGVDLQRLRGEQRRSGGHSAWCPGREDARFRQWHDRARLCRMRRRADREKGRLRAGRQGEAAGLRTFRRNRAHCHSNRLWRRRHLWQARHAVQFRQAAQRLGARRRAPRPWPIPARGWHGSSPATPSLAPPGTTSRVRFRANTPKATPSTSSPSCWPIIAASA